MPKGVYGGILPRGEWSDINEISKCNKKIHHVKNIKFARQ
jgi:hypothetical protein